MRKLETNEKLVSILPQSQRYKIREKESRVEKYGGKGEKDQGVKSLENA